MCIVLDHFKIPHGFDYHAKNIKYLEVKVKEIMSIILLAVTKIETLLCKNCNNVENCERVKIKIQKLAIFC